jgi:molybdopterin/thiamine biosynthesis adenylyltransferase
MTTPSTSDEIDQLGADVPVAAGVLTQPSQYRYGAGFVDAASGVRFEGHHPLARPDLWSQYLEGLEETYGARNLMVSRNLEELRAGVGVSLFFLGVDSEGRAVSGLRLQGPLDTIHDAVMVEEMAESPEIGVIKERLGDLVASGACEVKGAWSRGGSELGYVSTDLLVHLIIHAAYWLGAESSIATVDERLLAAGYRESYEPISFVPVPYPDERYHTVALSFPRATAFAASSDETRGTLVAEAEQFLESTATVDKDSADPSRATSSHPLVLNPTVAADAAVLQIIRNEPRLIEIDRLYQQVAQLTTLVPALKGGDAEPDAHWVYYPWRRTLVHVVGPRPFSILRLTRNRNKITRDEQAKLASLRIGIVGLSAGHVIAHTLALEGLAGELRLADFDTLELSNMNRIPATMLDLGVNKATIAARRIAELDPYLKVVIQPEGITDENIGAFLDGLDLVIEECDSLDMKLLVREHARARRIPVIMETSDRGVLDVERFDLEPDRPVFHGLLGDIGCDELAGLSLAEKTPYVLRIIGASTASSRGAASLLEVGSTLSGWPQLGSEVTLGAVTAAAAVRRFGLDGDLASGRVHFDVEEILNRLAPVGATGVNAADLLAPAPEDPTLVTGDIIEHVVDAARRAPSGGNVQAWRFEATNGSIDFFYDPDHSHSAMDIDQRGSLVALGAGVLNARVAAAARHRLGPVRIFPEGRYAGQGASHAMANHVATMTLGNERDTALAGLAPYLESRVSNRRLGSPTTIVADDVEALRRAVTAEGGRLHFYSDREQIAQGAKMLGAADRLRFLLPTVHSQMLSEVKWPGQDDLHTGLDVRSLEMDATGLAALELLARGDVMGHLTDWRAGAILAARTEMAVATSSALALITVPRSDPTWYVRGGGALERFWLTAEMLGLGVQPAAPLYVYAVDEIDLLELGGERNLDELDRQARAFAAFWDLEAGESMIMALRVLHAPRPSVHSIRRPLSEVLTRRSAL